MGLDIYFSKCRKGSYTSYKEKEDKVYQQYQDKVINLGEFWDWQEKNSPMVEIGYFRKVNFLIGFFEYDLDENGYQSISKDSVEELIEQCSKILEKRDEEYSEENLPTCSGFFFGSTEYDDWYYNDVQNVLDTFIDIFVLTDWENEEIYMNCSW